MSSVPVTITYLEMNAPVRARNDAPREDLTIVRANPPSLRFYRFLYNAVGDGWEWNDRNQVSDAALEAIVQHSHVEVHVLYASGNPVGYAELDRRTPRECQLAYFGLIPAYIGQGLGRYFLDWAIHTAFTPTTERLWVHTCTLDHPRALSTYQAAGFRIFKRETNAPVSDEHA